MGTAQLLNLSHGSGIMPAGAGGSLDSWYNYEIIRVIFNVCAANKMPLLRYAVIFIKWESNMF